MFGNTIAYQDITKRQIMESKKEIDKLIDDKVKSGEIDNNQLALLEQERFLRPLFMDCFGSNQRFRSPW